MLVIKSIGIILLVCSCALIGFLKSRSLSARSYKLSLLLDGVNMLYENIEYGSCTLCNAVKNSFERCEFLLYKGGTYTCCDKDLKQENNLICNFFKELGTLPKKAECDRINDFKIKLKKYLKEANSDYAQKGKIYGALGVCLGLTLAILLI